MHDLVEVFAGDVDPFIDPKQKIESKRYQEQLAFKKLQTNYPDISSILSYVEKYEAKADDESMLIYILDKFLPDTNIYLSKDNYYKNHKITLEAWLKWLNSKIDYQKIPPKLKIVYDDALKEITNKYKITFYTE